MNGVRQKCLRRNKMTNVILVNGKNPDMNKVAEATKKYNTTTIVFNDVARTKASKLVGDKGWKFYFPHSIKHLDMTKALNKAGLNVVGTVDAQLVEKKTRPSTEQKWIDAGYKKESASWVNKESNCENGHISVEEHQKIERYFARLLGYKSGKLPWYVAAKLSESEILWQAEMGIRDEVYDMTPSQRKNWKTNPNYYL